jgi:hemolysin III
MAVQTRSYTKCSIKKDGRMFDDLLYCEGRAKPYFRGFFHLITTVILMPFYFYFTYQQIDNIHELIAVAILYGGSYFSFGTSTLFHCFKWDKHTEISLQKLDHSAIFINIACVYTPVSLVLLNQNYNKVYLAVLVTLILTWIAALFGVYHVYNFRSQRMKLWVGTILLSLPAYPILSTCLTKFERRMAILGLASYAIGAYIFSKRFKFIEAFCPLVFGYHEIFHAFTILSFTCTILLLYSVISDTSIRCHDNAFDAICTSS